MRHCLGLATKTQISVCKSPFPSAGTAVSRYNDHVSQIQPVGTLLRALKGQALAPFNLS